MRTSQVPEYTALFFRVTAGPHGAGTTLNSRPGAVLSALALFLIKTTTGRGGRGEKSAEIKKFTGARRHSMAS